MGEAGAVQAAEDGTELLEQHALEVRVFLVGADYVGRGGERVGVVYGGFWSGEDDGISRI